MDADQLLQSLAVALGIPDLGFDDNGCARIAADGAPAVNLERDADGGSIQVYSVVAPLPPENREAFYSQLLEGNLFGNETAGAALAIDTLRGEVVLCRTFGAEVASGHAFVAGVEGFVAAAEDWQLRLGRPAEDEEATIHRPPQPHETANHMLRL